MEADVRGTAQYAAVSDHLHRIHDPGLGRPVSLREIHVSGDGARVVATGSVYDELVGLPRSVVLTVEDGELRAVCGGRGSAQWPRLSPDGTTLAFLSDRARPGVFQLHLLAEDRFGEAVAAPAVPGTIEYAHWSPDGARLLLGVAGLGADLSGGQGSGVNVHADDERPAWLPLVESGAGDEAWRSLWLYTVADGTLSRLSAEGVNSWEAEWCGDGGVVAITSSGPSEDDWYDAELVLIDVVTGSSRVLLRSDVQLGLPAGSPDGARIAVVQAVCSDRWVVAGDLIVIEAATGRTTAIDTGGVDVTRVQWLDAQRLGYFGQRHLDSVAGIVDVATGRVEEVFSTELSCGGGRYPDGAFTRDGRAVVTRDAYHLPPHLAVYGAGDDGEVLARTDHPGTDHQLTLCGTARPVTWSAPDGLEIEGILCTPDGDGPFPLVVNVHGGPIWAYRNSWSMLYPWVPLLVSRGYAVLNPNPRGSGGRGQDFAGHVVGDMGGADTHDYLSGIDALVEQGVADPARIGLIGGSYGGFMSSWLVTQDQRFAAAVPIAPVTDWYSQSFTSNIAGWGNAFLRADPEQAGSQVHTRSPVLQASRVRTPCLTVAGANDRCTPPGQAREFHQALSAHGVRSALVIYPEEGHGVRRYPAQIDFLTRVMDWFEEHMPARDGAPH
jgi:dipeptidyl aminopeptidase/acylaminoacyl peptidase